MAKTMLNMLATIAATMGVVSGQEYAMSGTEYNYWNISVEARSRVSVTWTTDSGAKVSTYGAYTPLDPDPTAQETGFTSGKMPSGYLDPRMCSEETQTLYLAAKCTAQDCVATKANFTITVTPLLDFKEVAADTVFTLDQEETIIKFSPPEDFNFSAPIELVFTGNRDPANFKVERIEEQVANGDCVPRKNQEEEPYTLLAPSTQAIYMVVTGTIGTYPVGDDTVTFNYQTKLETNQAASKQVVCRDQKARCREYQTRDCLITRDLGCQMCTKGTETGCSYYPSEDSIDACADVDDAGRPVNTSSTYESCPGDWTCFGIVCVPPSTGSDDDSGSPGGSGESDESTATPKAVATGSAMLLLMVVALL